jgi:lipoprotein-anchoring transpeptidase ErfK/SrfK
MRLGDAGAAVKRVQQRLSALGYWLGPADGEYGDLTRQAVMALQKAAGISRDGIYGPASRRALDAETRPRARTTSGNAVEVDLGRQLLLVVQAGRITHIFNTSTGSGQTYTSRGAQHVAVTPTGRYSFYRAVDGEDRSPLGVLWRPRYFNGGIAVHGFSSVPPYPASHGCVRVSNAAMDMIWSAGIMSLGRTVLVY